MYKKKKFWSQEDDNKLFEAVEELSKIYFTNKTIHLPKRDFWKKIEEYLRKHNNIDRTSTSISARFYKLTTNKDKHDKNLNVKSDEQCCFMCKKNNEMLNVLLEKINFIVKELM